MTIRPQIVFISGLVCDTPILADIMDHLRSVGDLHFVDYFKVELDTMDKLAEASYGVVADLDSNRPVFLVTFSMGGYVSSLLLEKMHKDQSLRSITGVCAIESNLYNDTEARIDQRNALLEQIEGGDFENVISKVVETEWYLQETVKNHPDIIAESKSMIRKLGADVFSAQTLALRDRNDAADTLKYFTMPVQLIVGDQSPLSNKVDLRTGLTPKHMLSQGIPHATCVTIERAGHMVPRTHPGMVASHIQDFISECLPSFSVKHDKVAPFLSPENT